MFFLRLNQRSTRKKLQMETNTKKSITARSRNMTSIHLPNIVSTQRMKLDKTKNKEASVLSVAQNTGIMSKVNVQGIETGINLIDMRGKTVLILDLLEGTRKIETIVHQPIIKSVMHHITGGTETRNFQKKIELQSLRRCKWMLSCMKNKDGDA